MNKMITSILLVMALFSAAAAADINMDFDGKNKASAATGHKDLFSYLEAEAAKAGVTMPPPPPAKAIPAKRDGYIPPASGPGCVSGCDNGSDNGDGGGETPDWSERPFVAATCFAKADLRLDCFDKTPDQAAKSFAAGIVGEYVQGKAIQALIFIFPVSVNRLAALKALTAVEREGLKTAEQMLEADIQKQLASPMSGTEKERNMRIIAENERTINRWKGEATKESISGRNWTEVQAQMFRFNGGPAYQQLARTLLNKDWFKSRGFTVNVELLLAE